MYIIFGLGIVTFFPPMFFFDVTYVYNFNVSFDDVIYIHKRTHVHARTRTHTHARTHARTHTHTHTARTESKLVPVSWTSCRIPKCHLRSRGIVCIDMCTTNVCHLSLVQLSLNVSLHYNKGWPSREMCVKPSLRSLQGTFAFTKALGDMHACVHHHYRNCCRHRRRHRRLVLTFKWLP